MVWHPQGFIWRDCKPENILLTSKGRGAVKLADFGLSIDATEERPVTRAGTLDYMAPEVRPVVNTGKRGTVRRAALFGCMLQCAAEEYHIMCAATLDYMVPEVRQRLVWVQTMLLGQGSRPSLLQSWSAVP